MTATEQALQSPRQEGRAQKPVLAAKKQTISAETAKNYGTSCRREMYGALREKYGYANERAGSGNPRQELGRSLFK